MEERKAAKTDPNVDPEIYEAYVGEYIISGERGTSMNILREGDKLYSQVGAGRKMELLPESENRFFRMFLQISWRPFFRELTVIFLKDDTGKVNELEITRVNGNKISARRVH